MIKFVVQFAAVIWVFAFAVSAASPAPRWLRDKIKAIEKLNPKESLEIGKWKFESKTVYLLPARCCDIAAEVFTTKGESLCRLEGGFANAPDERCKDFRAHAKLIEVVWKSKP